MRPVAIGLVAVLATGCTHGRTRGGKACDGANAAECEWNDAVKAPTVKDGPQGSTPAGPKTQVIVTGWDPVERLLLEMASLMGDGMAPGVIEAEARRWCEGDPTPQDRAHGPSWTCALTDPSRTGGADLVLEVGGGGVVSLGAKDISDAQARDLLGRARDRWRAWCQAGAFVEVETTDANEEFHRCVLPGGATLVLGRFPRDLDDGQWQVALAVMAAG